MGMIIKDEAKFYYLTGLRNAHAMETQAIELLTRQIERLENYPEMEAKLREHLEESKAQRMRLEEVLDSLGESHSALKEAVLGLGGNFAAMAHTIAADEIIKNTLANSMFEHFEIAAYKSLHTMAEYIDHQPGAHAAQANLLEEVAMAEWIDHRISHTTIAFLDRATAGVTASH